VAGPQTYKGQGVPVGEATFWIIGRDTNDWQTGPVNPVFGLVDEASKLNLNLVQTGMLAGLPRMTADLEASIITWGTSNTNAATTLGGAGSTAYQMLNPPYLCKSAKFETPEELRLVYGMSLDVLYGEDMNLNGILDLNENDGNSHAPFDNNDGKLDPGLLEYVTTFSHEPNMLFDGSGLPRVDVTTNTDAVRLAALLQNAGVSSDISSTLTNAPVGMNTNVLAWEIYASGLGVTDAQLAVLDTNITATATNNLIGPGLVNINTARETVLACIPGIGLANAANVVAYRKTNPDKLGSVHWLANVLDTASAQLAGTYVTAHSYQYSADIAAVGRHGRGYRRIRLVFDTSSGSPVIVYRQDLTHLGWALGKQGRTDLALLKGIR